MATYVGECWGVLGGWSIYIVDIQYIKGRSRMLHEMMERYKPFQIHLITVRLGEVPGGIYSVSHQPTEYASITDDSDDGAWSDYESLFQDYDYQYRNSPDNIYIYVYVCM